MADRLQAGAGTVEITPKDSQFLFGYPHVERYSTGVHDPLLSSALYLSDGDTKMMFIANDVIFVPKAMAARARKRIEQSTSIPAANIMISATHTHSGPITVNYLSSEPDPVVPKADSKYLALMENALIEAAQKAYRSVRSAEIALTVADATGVGTNRRDPAGPSDPQVPVLLVRHADDENPIAAMLVHCMHPTVLHEDSKLISGDYPAMARIYLQKHVLGEGCCVLHHTGPAGNQSPRHCVQAQTFAEAERLGNLLGKAVEEAIPRIEFTSDVKLTVLQDFVDLPRRRFPSVDEAEEKLQTVVAKLQSQRRDGTPRAEVRTTECDWFGAEETVVLARAARDGRLEKVYDSYMPAEIQVFAIGDWTFVAWPGEVFIEYALAVKAERPDTFVISLANGELQGYIVTPEAAEEGGYEASNALFDAASGQVLVNKTLEMLGRLGK